MRIRKFKILPIFLSFSLFMYFPAFASKEKTSLKTCKATAQRRPKSKRSIELPDSSERLEYNWDMVYVLFIRLTLKILTEYTKKTGSMNKDVNKKFFKELCSKLRCKYNRKNMECVYNIFLKIKPYATKKLELKSDFLHCLGTIDGNMEFFAVSDRSPFINSITPKEFYLMIRNCLNKY